MPEPRIPSHEDIRRVFGDDRVPGSGPGRGADPDPAGGGGDDDPRQPPRPASDSEDIPHA